MHVSHDLPMCIPSNVWLLQAYAYVHVLHDLPEASLMVVQDHGLEAGLDIQLIPQCASALPEDPKTQPPQPVYLEMPVVNTNRYPCRQLNGCLVFVTCVLCSPNVSQTVMKAVKASKQASKVMAPQWQAHGLIGKVMAPNGKVMA